jgi:RNA polymerase sigma-70 factor (ECF subfamily)
MVAALTNTRIPASPSDQDSAAGRSAEICWPSTTRLMAAGDATALARFYEFTFDIMYREAARVSGRDEHCCLDIVHDAMLKAVRCIKQLDNAASVTSWSRAVAKSVTYDWLRKESRKQKLENVRPARMDQTSGHGVDIGEFSMDQARILWIEQELKELPDELQGLIALRYRWGWSLQEIGQSIGLKTGAVDGRLRRAIKKLRRKAEIEFDET